jgi:DNA-binding XRE family transcriptional regulator
MVFAFLNNYVDSAIKKSTIMSIEAKKYSFYWLLYLSIAETFALIVYSG